MAPPAKKPATQLPLPMQRERYPDRNMHKGGRSFYFFDFDDNVMCLGTPIYIFERHSRAEIALSTAEFARVSPQLGQPGAYENYEVDPDDSVGSFRRFRDSPPNHTNGEQPFVEDVRTALAGATRDWKGPSWEIFFHAVHNQRPLAIITARGHDPTTIAHGIDLLREAGHLSATPNYLTIFPVSEPQIRASLGAPTIPELKMAAIVRSVETAMQTYDDNPHHRFGMSEDAPDNLELVTAAMSKLKERYPDNAFYVIDTSGHPVVKTEILPGTTSSEEVTDITQLSLFSGVDEAPPENEAPD